MPNETKIQKDSLCENVFTECSEDFILPDYMPEIRRVVRLESKLLQGENYVNGGKAEFEGTVLYTLFYTDTEEKLTAVPLESRYEYRVSVGGEVPQEVYTEESLESVNARPSGPRRLNIRSKIRAAVHGVWEQITEEPHASLEDASACEKLWRMGESLRSIRQKGEEFEISAEKMLESDGEEIRPVYGTAEILIESARASDGHVRCTGTALIKVLAEKGGEILSLSSRIPFEEEIISNASLEGDSVSANGVCARVELETEEDGGHIFLHAKAYGKIETVNRRNEPFAIVSDMYSIKEQLALSYRPFSTVSLLEDYTGNFTVEAEGKIPDCAEITLCSVSVREANFSRENGRSFLSGECRADLLCRAEEGFFGTDLLFPFRIEIPIKEIEAETPCFSLSPLFAEAFPTQEGCRVCFEMAVKLCASKTREDPIPVSITSQGAREKRNADSVVIYYPTDKDSLWSLGKKYGMRTEELGKQNGIPMDGDTAWDSETSLDGYARLFVSKL